MSAVSIPTHTGSTSELQGPIVVRDRHVTVDGITTQYLEAGSGPTLLLLHGHEQSATSWRWVIPALARTHRVLALSLPGHGDTAERRLRPRQRHRSVRHRLSRHPRRRSAARGRTLRRWRRRPPAGPRRPGPRPDPGPGRQRRARPRSAPPAGRGHPALRRGAGDPAQPPARRQHGTHHHVRGDAVRPTLAGTRRLLHRARPRRRRGQLEASTATARALFDATGQRQILLDRLPAVTAPTLVVWGGCDYVLPAHQAQTAVGLLPHGRLALLSDCGHLPHVEHPDRFAAVLGDWLTEHGAVPSHAAAASAVADLDSGATMAMSDSSTS